MLVLFCIKSCFKCSVYILKSIFQYNKKGVLQNAPFLCGLLYYFPRLNFQRRAMFFINSVGVIL